MKLLKSIKTRLLFWQMLLLAGVLITLLSLHYHIRHNELIATTDIELRRIQMMAMPVIAPMDIGSIRRPPPLHIQENRKNPEFIAEKTLDNIEKENAYVISWSLTNGEEQSRYGKVPESSKFKVYNSLEQLQQIWTRDGNRELVIHHGNRALIVIGRPLKHLEKQMEVIRQNMIMTGILVFLLGWIGGRVILNRGLLPIEQISQTALDIAEGRREKRIELADAPEELEGMSMTLNKTFDSLDEAIRRQARFTADASHELRTPISIILAQTQAALRKERTPEQYISALTACLRAGQRMKNLSESLLDLTRIDAQEVQLEKCDCDLNSILQDAADLTDDISDRHKVEYHSASLPVNVVIDKNRIHQSIVNLTGNAIKYNPDGCKIDLSLETDEKNAIIKVLDNGIGIPAEHLTHIFDRFYRVDKSRSRESGGSGLGLSIVKNIIAAHNGEISVESTPGVETVFRIRLPLANVH